MFTGFHLSPPSPASRYKGDRLRRSMHSCGCLSSSSGTNSSRQPRRSSASSTTRQVRTSRPSKDFGLASPAAAAKMDRRAQAAVVSASDSRPGSCNDTNANLRLPLTGANFLPGDVAKRQSSAPSALLPAPFGPCKMTKRRPPEVPRICKSLCKSAPRPTKSSQSCGKVSLEHVLNEDALSSAIISPALSSEAVDVSSSMSAFAMAALAPGRTSLLIATGIQQSARLLRDVTLGTSSRPLSSKSNFLASTRTAGFVAVCKASLATPNAKRTWEAKLSPSFRFPEGSDAYIAHAHCRRR
mmetsp:Transcript_41796/g.97599  ORF Transcript_41796/g.97599 Transcript_41796/m.97599 type:complete len:298 (+) Transcript_41796:316-1209(+)